MEWLGCHAWTCSWRARHRACPGGIEEGFSMCEASSRCARGARTPRVRNWCITQKGVCMQAEGPSRSMGRRLTRPTASRGPRPPSGSSPAGPQPVNAAARSGRTLCWCKHHRIGWSPRWYGSIKLVPGTSLTTAYRRTTLVRGFSGEGEAPREVKPRTGRSRRGEGKISMAGRSPDTGARGVCWASPA